MGWAGPLGGFGFRRMARLLISDNRRRREVKPVLDPIFITGRVQVRPVGQNLCPNPNLTGRISYGYPNRGKIAICSANYVHRNCTIVLPSAEACLCMPSHKEENRKENYFWLKNNSGRVQPCLFVADLLWLICQWLWLRFL